MIATVERIKKKPKESYQFLCTEHYIKYKGQSKRLSAGTLGPTGSSSDESLRFINNSGILSDQEMGTTLYCTFEELQSSLLNNNVQIAIVPHAYQNISIFYMTPKIELLGVFIFPTPVYGLARKKGSQKNLVNCDDVLTHPAPLPLVDELVPEQLRKNIRIQFVNSTSKAASMMAEGLDVLAITNEKAVSQYGLEFISTYGEIVMSWSIFGRKQ